MTKDQAYAAVMRMREAFGVLAARDRDHETAGMLLGLADDATDVAAFILPNCRPAPLPWPPAGGCDAP